MILLLNFYSAFSSAVSCDDLQNIKENMALILRHFMPYLLKEEMYEFTNIARICVSSGKGILPFVEFVSLLPCRHAPLS